MKIPNNLPINHPININANPNNNFNNHPQYINPTRRSSSPMNSQYDTNPYNNNKLQQQQPNISIHQNYQ